MRPASVVDRVEETGEHRGLCKRERVIRQGGDTGFARVRMQHRKTDAHAERRHASINAVVEGEIETIARMREQSERNRAGDYHDGRYAPPAPCEHKVERKQQA